MEHDIPFGNSNRENGTTFLDFPLFLGIFQWDEPTKRVPFTAGPEIPEILTEWKAPSVCYFYCLYYPCYIVFNSYSKYFCKLCTYFLKLNKIIIITIIIIIIIIIIFIFTVKPRHS